MKKLILLILICTLSGCDKTACQLPEEYENIKDLPDDEQLLGSYKILDDTSGFRIKLEKSRFSNELKIIGNLPWCNSSDTKEIKGSWGKLSEGNFYSNGDDFGVVIQPNEEVPGLGLGMFQIKRFRGGYSLVFPWYEGLETCDRFATQILTCDYITFIKE